MELRIIGFMREKSKFVYPPKYSNIMNIMISVSQLQIDLPEAILGAKDIMVVIVRHM